jgi:4-amino-4-deoxy-L-arabinose transferase-like glycosyltransferase
MALAGVLAITLAVRLWVVTSALGRMDADEAVTGVMALRILRGDFPAYFGMQNYQGALEQYLQAPLMLIAPSSELGLRLVQVALAVVIGALSYSLARILTGSQWAGVLAAALLALGPYYLVVKGVKSHGAYAGGTTAMLVMLVTLFILRPGSPHARWVAAGAGLAAGVALWESLITLYAVLPAGLWFLATARTGRNRGLIPWAAAGIVLGLAPALAYTARHGLHSPVRSNQQPDTGYLERMANLFEFAIPRFLGATPGTSGALIITVAAVAGVGWAAWARRHGLVDLVLLRTTNRRPIDLVIATFLVTPFLYALTPFTWLTTEPRYLFTLYPLAAVAIVWAIWQLHRPPMRAFLGASLLTVSTVVLVPAIAESSNRAQQGPIEMGSPVRTEMLAPVADALKRQGVRAAYADYWTAIPLQFESGDQIDVSAGAVGQFPDSEGRVAQTPSPAVVVASGPESAAIARRLMADGHSFALKDVNGFTIFSSIEPPWRPPPVT